MKSHTSLVAQQTRLSEWADLIRDCQNRLQGMKIDEWCQLHDITKASYYWRLRKVREAYLETADLTQTFVEVPSSAIHPVNMASEYKRTDLGRRRIPPFIRIELLFEIISWKAQKLRLSKKSSRIMMYHWTY